MCFVTEQKVPFVYLTSMEAVIPQGSWGELSIVLFQLAYKFITIEREAIYHKVH